MSENKDKINNFLQTIYFPYTRKNIVEAGFAKSILEKNGVFYILLDGKIDSVSNGDIAVLQNKIEAGISIKFGLKCLCVIEKSENNSKELESDKNKISSDFSGSFIPIKGVNKTICIISGKGGVGKTTTALGLAYNLKCRGFKVGVCDLDIYGPSVPSFLNILHKHKFENGLIMPFLKDEIKFASIGMMTDSSEPIIWRGPMLTKAMNQLIREVDWGDLEYLVIDTPPGTGDIHLSLLQKFPIDYAVAVTTNDETSVKNTIKSINMLRKLSRPIDLLITNMAYLEKNGEKFVVFGEDDFAKNSMQNLNIENFIGIPVFNKKEEILSFNFNDFP